MSAAGVGGGKPETGGLMNGNGWGSLRLHGSRSYGLSDVQEWGWGVEVSGADVGEVKLGNGRGSNATNLPSHHEYTSPNQFLLTVFLETSELKGSRELNGL